MYLYNLSKQDVELARDEVIALTGKNYKIDKNYLITSKLTKRPAYTKTVSLILFECSSGGLLHRIKKYNWNKVYKNNFKLIIHKVPKLPKDFNEKNLSSYIYRQLKNPEVRLRNPETIFEIFFTDRAYVTLRVHTNSEDFNSRKSHNRPEPHPTSLHPKIARAMVNLTGIKRGRLFDPFCGAGGILIEAGLMGLKPVGYDLDRIMLRRAEINLRHFGVNAVLQQKDATTVNNIKYICTDLPYARNSKAKDLEQLYTEFLTSLKFREAVIAFPDKINYKAIILKTGHNVRKEYSYYLHKSLTKKIVVLD